MPGHPFERYGLTGNPFRELSSETVEDVPIFHVNLEIDVQLRTIKEEVLDKENHALVALVGGPGTGKTERLRLAIAEAKERGALSIYVNVAPVTAVTIRDIARGFQEAGAAHGYNKTFSSPKWFRDVTALVKLREDKYDPAEVGKTIAAALAGAAPSFLLLNDLHNLGQTGEVDPFSTVLQEIADGMAPGVLVMFGSYTNYLIWLVKNRPAMGSRINRAIALPKLSTDEASLLIAKKMLVRRVVEDLDPLYPFDHESVEEITMEAGGNPRRVLTLADLAIEYGADHRVYRIDADVVRAVLPKAEETEPFRTTRPAATPSGPVPMAAPVGAGVGNGAPSPAEPTARRPTPGTP